jgi:hypothetical protein
MTIYLSGPIQHSNNIAVREIWIVNSYFVNIGYDRTAISFVDLHTYEFKVNIALKQYAWLAIDILDENAVHLFVLALIKVPVLE